MNVLRHAQRARADYMRHAQRDKKRPGQNMSGRGVTLQGYQLYFAGGRTAFTAAMNSSSRALPSGP